MSALNCYIGDDAVHLFTDGNIFNVSDVSARKGNGNKIAILPKFNAVVGATGMHGIPLIVDGFLLDRGYETFDELAEGFGPFMKYAVDSFRNAQKLVPTNPVVADWGQFEAILAGWSDFKDAPQAFLVREFVHQGVPAFTATEITEHYAPFAPGMQYHRWNRDDIAGSGLELLRAQHAMKFPVASGPQSKREMVEGSFSLAEPKTFSVVGGFAQHTRVDRDGITVRVLERWDDDQVAA